MPGSILDLDDFSLRATPDSRGETPISQVNRALVMRDKGKGIDRSAAGRRSASAGPSRSSLNGSKRRRITMERDDLDDDDDEEEDEDDDEGVEDEEEEEEEEEGDDPVNVDAEDESDSDAFDPDQPMQERRRVQRGLRSLMREVNTNAEHLLSNNDTHGLRNTFLRANELAKDVRQTSEATIDSRLLVTTADLTYRKILRLTQGSAAQGIDVDELVSKAISFMRLGGGIENDDAPELSSTQRQRRVGGGSRRRRTLGGRDDVGDEDEEIGDEGDSMNWPHLGQYGALPVIGRPGLANFLIGPLGTVKKARKVTKRSAPFRPDDAKTRPEVLDVQDLAKKENDLTAICSRILQRLKDVQAEIQQTVEDEIRDDMDENEAVSIMLKHGLRDTGGVDFMRFVINPKSFGQTVENMFYVSFLIRDGKVGIDFDDQDLPSLSPKNRDEVSTGQTARSGASKHQAIFTLDAATWQEIIRAFNIKEPMIPHRKESSSHAPGARGWYS